MNLIVKCAECDCTPSECNVKESSEIRCINCTKEDKCCCLAIHVVKDKNYCCSDPSCRSDILSPMKAAHPTTGSGIRTFFSYAKGLYAAALGIEILCIAAAEIGENTGLYLFGFNASGIAIAYVLGYALAGFTTFVTILGRYGNQDQDNAGIDSCCSVLEQGSSQQFVPNLKSTFSNFASGFKRLSKIHEQRGMKMILKSSLFILVTAESACILTAETVGVIFYQYSLLLSAPLALLAGAFTVVAPAAYRKAKQTVKV